MSDEPQTGPIARAVEMKAPGPRTLLDARRAVEESRERIAATLDELEDRIVETKESIKRKADLARPARDAIRKAPLIALGVAVAVGLFLGTRGGEEEEEDEYGFDKDERKALEEWRKRRREMLMYEAEDAGEAFEEEVEEPGAFGKFIRSVGHEVAGVAIGIIAAEIAERMYGARAVDEVAADRGQTKRAPRPLQDLEEYEEEVYDDEEDDLDEQ